MAGSGQTLALPGELEKAQCCLPRAFIAPVALLSQPSRYRCLADLLDGLGYCLQLLRGGQSAAHLELLARMQELKAWRMVEELYPQRASFRYQLPSPGLSLLLVQRGRCILELPGQPGISLHLQAEQSNVAVLAAPWHDLTITQAPFRVVRFVLPAGSMAQLVDGPTIEPALGLRVELGLLLPMQRLLEQAWKPGSPAATREELSQILFDYVLHQLLEARCAIHVHSPAPPADDPLSQLQVWLSTRLDQPLQLGDLAVASALSARRLQELCREQKGCTPMEWLRALRLEAFAEALRDPAQSHRSLAALHQQWQLPESLATRRAFTHRFGCSASDYRQAPEVCR